MPFAVVACSSCKAPWAVDLRHAKVSCPRCRAPAELRKRRRLWEGGGAAEAQAAAAHLAAALSRGEPGDALQQVGALADDRPLPRHDSTVDAAAAKGRAVRNASARADEVAAWMTRLSGGSSHEELVAALCKAGLSADRAEREIVRMLATDVVFEPRPGQYQALDV